jgi:hypothetical protein
MRDPSWIIPRLSVFHTEVMYLLGLMTVRNTWMWVSLPATSHNHYLGDRSAPYVTKAWGCLQSLLPAALPASILPRQPPRAPVHGRITNEFSTNHTSKSPGDRTLPYPFNYASWQCILKVSLDRFGYRFESLKSLSNHLAITAIPSYSCRSFTPLHSTMQGPWWKSGLKDFEGLSRPPPGNSCADPLAGRIEPRFCRSNIYRECSRLNDYTRPATV